MTKEKEKPAELAAEEPAQKKGDNPTDRDESKQPPTIMRNGEKWMAKAGVGGNLTSVRVVERKNWFLSGLFGRLPEI